MNSLNFNFVKNNNILIYFFRFEGEESNLSVIHSSRLFKSDSLLERFLKETGKMENSTERTYFFLI